jgi:hypothetical protein
MSNNERKMSNLAMASVLNSNDVQQDAFIFAGYCAKKMAAFLSLSGKRAQSLYRRLRSCLSQ